MRAVKHQPHQSKETGNILNNSQLKTPISPMNAKPNASSGEGIMTFGAALKNENESLVAFLQNKQLPKSVSKQITPTPSDSIFVKNRKIYTMH
jgi:hypothetical protein